MGADYRNCCGYCCLVSALAVSTFAWLAAILAIELLHQGHSTTNLCSSYDGHCNGFFQACAAEDELTVVELSAPDLCMLSRRCCAPESVGFNGTTQLGASPPFGSVFLTMFDVAEVNSMPSMCPKIAEVVPPGLAVLVMQSVIGTFFASQLARTMPAAVSRVRRRGRSNLRPAEHRCVEAQGLPTFMRSTILTSRLIAPSVQTGGAPSEIHVQSTLNDVHELMKARRRCEQETVEEWFAEKPDRAWASKLFRVSPLLGIKCGRVTVFALASAIQTGLENGQEAGWSAWLTYNGIAV